MSISSASELESSLVSFAGSDSIPLQLDREGIKEREGGKRGGGGRLSEGMAIIQGNMVVCH